MRKNHCTRSAVEFFSLSLSWFGLVRLVHFKRDVIENSGVSLLMCPWSLLLLFFSYMFVCFCSVLHFWLDVNVLLLTIKIEQARKSEKRRPLNVRPRSSVISSNTSPKKISGKIIHYDVHLFERTKLFWLYIIIVFHCLTMEFSEFVHFCKMFVLATKW